MTKICLRKGCVTIQTYVALRIQDLEVNKVQVQAKIEGGEKDHQAHISVQVLAKIIGGEKDHQVQV